MKCSDTLGSKGWCLIDTQKHTVGEHSHAVLNSKSWNWDSGSLSFLTLTGDIQPWSAAILVTGFCPREKLVVKYLNVTRHLLNMLSCKGLEVRHFYSRFEVSMAQFQNVPLTFNSRTGSDVFYIHSRPQCRADLVNYCIVVLGFCQHAWLTAQNFILIFQVFLKVTVLWGEKKILPN